ncbi:hypothetical protein [Sphingobacterium gobiense]|uniref:Membrane or secreted protein n=1 Tax=Sphingobacterium gobiense TaxID=1382456 RepID=A0A2S9JVP2_9SPHI|nr:hypothetical protein [Sphingobacterium gobiense]PRD57327.1 hypothetical protein C5749_09090 [Sphingobacterium gobiense]
MKKLILSAVLLFFATLIMAQTAANLKGVYTAKKDDANIVWMFIDGYSSQTTYKNNAYISTFGGPYTYQDGALNVQVEYDDADVGAIGQTKSWALTANADGLQEQSGKAWKKEAAKAQDLDGLWRITGRKQGNDLVQIHQSGTRKTIKLLVDGYFQWMAIDPGAKTFSGTGGGHYTFTSGKYSEHILFFSRDNSRVGTSLSFDGELKDGTWHHSGLSSKGDPIYEIWSRDNK